MNSIRATTTAHQAKLKPFVQRKLRTPTCKQVLVRNDEKCYTLDFGEKWRKYQPKVKKQDLSTTIVSRRVQTFSPLRRAALTRSGRKVKFPNRLRSEHTLKTKLLNLQNKIAIYLSHPSIRETKFLKVLSSFNLHKGSLYMISFTIILEYFLKLSVSGRAARLKSFKNIL